MQYTLFFDRLGMTIKDKSVEIPPIKAEDSGTLDGLSVGEVRALATKSSAGLSYIQNYPVATSEVAAVGTSPNAYQTTYSLSHQIKQRATLPAAEDGSMFFLDGASFSNLVPRKALGFLSVVTTDAELNTMFSTQEKMADVFNSWKKISRGCWNDATKRIEYGFSDSAIQSELDGFTYDAATDKIKNSADTFSLVGFISPTAYDNYVLDVILRSDSTWQNDPLGLIVGYVMDADGTTHTLSIMRNLWYPSYSTYGAVDVVVDYNTVGQTLIKTQRAGLKWVDGSDATGNMVSTAPAFAIKPWAQAVNGCRLKVTRAGDTFTVETTQYDETAFVDAAKFTFTLNDHASLARFKGPQRYGYAAISQDYAIWDVQLRPGARQAVVDIRDKSVREWNGTAWVTKTGGWADYVKPNRFYYNRTTKKLFYAENLTSLIQVL